MTRIEDILLRARDVLVDYEKERWSDERLLRLVDEAQQDIARHSKLFKGHYVFSLDIGEHTYNLPDDLWLITHATFKDCMIPLVSYDQMDEAVRKPAIDYSDRRRGSTYPKACWETDTGCSIESLIYDNRNMQVIRVYPTPNECIAENDYTFQNAGYLDPTLRPADSPFGVLTGVTPTDSLVDELGVTTDAESIAYIITDPGGCNGIELVDDVMFNSPYGVLAEVEDLVKNVEFHGDALLGVVVGIDDYTADSPYGVVTDLYDPAIATEKFFSVYGVVTSVNESTAAVGIRYIRIPDPITSVDDELEVPRMYDTAMRHYVVGHAFLDDNDAASREKSTVALTLYARELDLAKTTSALDGTRSPTTFSTSYRGPFE